MYCWKCNKKVESATKKISFRAFCENCDFDLHVCKNCKHYSLKKRNDCNLLDVEFVEDKEKRNFCEEFSFKEKPSKKNPKNNSLEEVEKKLFGKTEKDISKKKIFLSLFKDD